MANHFLFCFIFNLACCLVMQIGSNGNIEISRFAYLQKAGDMDTGCLHNITINNTVSDFTFTPGQERSYLLDFYNATGGSHWLQRKGWEINSSLHHCNWYGIECYKNSSYIKSINLIGNGLVGEPPNIWRFRNLQGLCLSSNKQMTGNISDVISSNMTRLRRLLVSFTRMSGDVPWELLLQLHDLEKIQLCCMTGSKLTGGLPHDIGILNKLQVLSIGENNIHGDLPLSIRNLTKLWFLDLEYVKLKSGDLGYFSNMSKLEYLHLTNCGLNGELPKNFGEDHPDMFQLHLHGNNLRGELNERFLGFKKIAQISLGSNQLSGSLPAVLGKLKTLQVLDLANNSFSGFAENMTFNAQLETLLIGQNANLNVDGNLLLKALLPCKYSLRMLVAKNCGLKGELSSSLWDLGEIMYIDLSQNNMTGTIPTNEAYSMVYLFYLTLAFNNFTGELPMSFLSPLKSLTYLDLRGNRYMKTKNIFSNSYLKPVYSETLQEDTLTCPTLRLTNSGGQALLDPGYYEYSLCNCNSGYYGYSKYCKACMQGASCQDKSKSLTNQMETKMTIQKGYWPCCGDFHDVTRMVKCSHLAEKTFDDEICSPSGKCKCELRLVSDQLKTSCNTSCVCRHGNKGRFCSQCIDGYYKKGSLCISCPEFRRNFPTALTVSFVVCLLGSVALLVCFKHRKKLGLVLMFVTAVTLIVLHLKSIIPGWFFVIIFAVWILGLSGGAGEKLESFLCITVFFFQSLDAMFSNANVWPAKIVHMKYQITNAFNFEISELTCSFSDATRPEVSFAVVLLLPVAAIFLIWLSHVLAKALCCQRVNIPSSLCKKLNIQILLFVYFPVTAKTFDAVLPCEHRDGLSYLKNTPWLDCDGNSYNWLVALGYVSLVLLVIGVPVFVFAPLLYKYLDHKGQNVFEDTSDWLKPLYKEYKEEYRRYFPLVFLTRRLLLAVFLTMVPTTSFYQVIGITLLLVIYIVIILVFRPYEQYSEKFEFETMADVVVSVVLLLSFVGLALLRVSTKFDNSLVWLIISLNLVVVLCCVVGILVLFGVNLWKSSENEQPGRVEYEPIPEAEQ